MTLLPCAPDAIRIPEQEGWVDPPTSWQCVNPTCCHRGTQTHEVVRRSATSGAKRWVAITGIVICNQVRVCMWCHEKINHHEAWIRFDEGQWIWWEACPANIGEVMNTKSGRWFREVGPLRGESE